MASIYLFYRHTPSGQSRVNRVTQLRTDGARYREFTGTAPVVLLECIVRVTGAAFSTFSMDHFICPFLSHTRYWYVMDMCDTVRSSDIKKLTTTFLKTGEPSRVIILINISTSPWRCFVILLLLESMAFICMGTMNAICRPFSHFCLQLCRELVSNILDISLFSM